jgi:hypothetical protein
MFTAGPTNRVTFGDQELVALKRGGRFASDQPFNPFGLWVSGLPIMPSGNTNDLTSLLIAPAIINNSLYSGITRGIYYNPTVTSLGSRNIHRAIETTRGDVIFGSTSGNVGIGTTSPTQRLQVSGDTLINGSLTANTISAGTYQNIQLSSVNNLETSLNNKFDKSGGTVSGDVFINGNVTILGTATTINTETLSVKDNLITLNSNATGNTSPLLINSGVEILRNSATTASLIWNEQDTRWEAGLTGSTKQIILSGDSLSLLNSGHTHPISEIINLQTSLDSKLDKSGGVISGSLVVTGGTGTNWFSGNTSSDMLRVTQTGSGNAFVVEDDTNPDSSPFVITSGGSVGIGTTSPTYILDVTGGDIFVATGSVRTNVIRPANSNQIISFTTTTGGVNDVGRMFLDGNTWRFKSQNSFDAINIFSNGNLGIQRANNSGYTFDVNGTTRLDGNTIINGALSGFTTSGVNWFSGNTNNDMLRVTQTGTGNAFVVEDESNPDSSPFVVTSTGNIGIGTTNPTERLQVSGDTLVNGGLTANTISATIDINVGQLGTNGQINMVRASTGTAVGGMRVQTSGAGTEVGGSGFGDKIIFGNGQGLSFFTYTSGLVTNNAERMRITAGATGGNLLIGTTTDTGQRLQVSGNTLINGALSGITTSGTNWFSGNTSSDMLRVTQTGSGNAFVVEDDTNPDSSPFVITSGGSVGIGTTNPTERLQVSGTSRFDNDVTIWDDGVFNGDSRKLSFRGLGQTGNTQTGVIFLDAFGGTNKEYLVLSAGGVRLNTNDADGTIQINNTASSIPKIQSIQSGGLAFEVNSTTNGFIFGQGYQQTTGDLFSIYNYGPTKVFSILASNSNVGIGTATPSEKLDVNGNTIINGALSGFTTSGVNWFSGNTSTDLLRVTQTGSGNAFVVEDETNPDSSPFVITSGGSVGIGTTSPTVPLDVLGSTKITTNLGGGGTSFSVFHQSTELFRIQENQRMFSNSLWSFTDTDTLNIYGGRLANNSCVRITAANLFDQINVTRNLLAVNNTIQYNSGSLTDYRMLTINPTINVTGGTSTIRGLFYNPIISGTTGVTHRAIETTSGDIVFGNGNLTVTGGTGTNWFSGNTNNDMLRVTQTGSGNAFVVEDETNPDSSPFVITSGGSVGIGTTSPSATLSVSGNTIVSGTLSGGTMVITTQPTSGYTTTQILMRNSTTGQVEITDRTSPSIYNYGMSYAMSTFNYST